MRALPVRVVLALALGIILACSGTVRSADIISVFPKTGVPGSSVSILGTGFGAKRGKVTLRPDGRKGKWKIKVTDWSDTRVRVYIKKASPGPTPPVLSEEKPRLGSSTVYAPVTSSPPRGFTVNVAGPGDAFLM